MRVAHLLAAGLLAASAASADETPRPSELTAVIEAERPLGSAEVSIFFFDLYRADLWTPARAAFDWSEPFALALTYKRAFTADELSEASINEIARITGVAEEGYAALQPLLTACFADVAEGDRITGLSLGGDAAQFFVNGRVSCDIRYPNFNRLFFGIWLDPRSRDPEAALELKGLIS